MRNVPGRVTQIQPFGDRIMQARKSKRGTIYRKAVQIRQGWTVGEAKRLGFCVARVCLAVEVGLVLSYTAG